MPSLVVAEATLSLLGLPRCVDEGPRRGLRCATLLDLEPNDGLDIRLESGMADGDTLSSLLPAN